MIKKKAKGKSKSKAKKSADVTTTKRSAKKPLDPVKVRQEIAEIVKANASGITKAVTLQATQGQLAPAKYLFEMAGVFPYSTDGTFSTENEDSLAKTLLNRLNIPLEPVVHDLLQKEEDDEIVIQPKPPARSDGASDVESGEKKSDAGSKCAAVEK